MKWLTVGIIAAAALAIVGLSKAKTPTANQTSPIHQTVPFLPAPAPILSAPKVAALSPVLNSQVGGNFTPAAVTAAQNLIAAVKSTPPSQPLLPIGSSVNVSAALQASNTALPANVAAAGLQSYIGSLAYEQNYVANYGYDAYVSNLLANTSIKPLPPLVK